jgi:peptidyl-prolyl cis-trans isomerase C
MRRLSSILAITVLVLAVASCSKREDRIVARVGNDVITLGQFEQEFRTPEERDSVAQMTLEQRKEYLNRLIDRRLQLLDAYELGLDKTPEVAARIQTMERRLVYRRLIERDVLSRVISDKQIRDEYDHMDREVRARQILLRVGSYSNGGSEKEVADRAWQIYRELKSGADFDSLLQRYTEDEKTKPRGGDLGYFRWGRMVEPFQRAAFSLKPGEISRPIRTRFGFHIIKVEDVRPVPRGSFEEERDRIRYRLASRIDIKKKIQDAFEEYARNVERKVRLTKKDEGIERFVRLMSQRLLAEKKAEMEDDNYPPGDQFGLFTDDDMATVLAVWEEDTLTIRDVVAQVRKMPLGQQSLLYDSTSVVSQVEGLLRQRSLLKFAYQQGLDRDPKVVDKMRSFRERLFLRRVPKQRVDERVEVTPEEVKAYYTTHQQRYKFPAQKKIREIQVSDVDLAFDIARRARAGEDFVKLVRLYNERETTKQQDGLLGFISAGAFGDVGSSAAGMKVGEIGGPVQLAGKYSVFQILDERGPRAMTFEQAAGRARRELLAEKRKARREEWMNELRQRYEIHVYDDVLLDAFQK